MHGTKIFYDDEDWEFIQSYKEATGTSIQRFTKIAVKRYREQLELEQFLKDQKLK